MSDSKSSVISCVGIKTNNLKNISVEFPTGKWTAVTGVSGSGKSSLVFDTIYAESQRRFLETLGTYERQFLQGLPQGEFDLIDNIPPAVALKQTNKSGDPRSVIASTVDITEPLRNFFTALMEPSCIKCGSPVEVHTANQLINYFTKPKFKNISYFLLTVSSEIPQEKSKLKELVNNLLIEGYIRVFFQDKIWNLEEDEAKAALIKHNQKFAIVLDRIVPGIAAEELQNRIETIWSQIRYSPRFSKLEIYVYKDSTQVSVDEFMVQSYCQLCNSHTEIIQSSDLDWQSALGACKNCFGLGNVPVIDEKKVIPDPNLSIEQGALKPFASKTFEWMNAELIRILKQNHVKTNVPYSALEPKVQAWIWGTDKPSNVKNSESFISLQDFFQKLAEDKYKPQSRILLAKYRKYIICEQCNGTRLGQAGRNAICNNLHFYDILKQEIAFVLNWVESLQKNPKYLKKITAIHEIYKEIVQKLGLLNRLGLGSTILERRTKSLSGGEYQRVLLARVIGNGLTDTLYVLDEPSVGLGKSEIPELIKCVQELRDLGNTILMVEHEPELIKAADHWIELGPGGGIYGGKILAKTEQMPVSAKFKSLQQLPEKKSSEKNILPISSSTSLQLHNFSMLNCHNLSVEFPLGKLTVITGPSGAGKSTLLNFGLGAALELLFEFNLTVNATENIDNLLGKWDKFLAPAGVLRSHEVVTVEQRALHRSSTSVIATVLGIMDYFRKYFASVDEAKESGFTISDFTFNGEGACETCLGKGVIKDDLFFLGEVEKTCPDCNGQRYLADVLKIKWHGKNIAEWLGTNLQDCIQLLVRYPVLQNPLKYACSLGLGHLPLGSATTTLSGGEAQRLRIASALSKANKKLICLLDEPTRGLSELDIEILLQTILNLCNQGHTFVVAEHHPGFCNFAHQLLELGPGGGKNGGKIVASSIRV